MFLYFYLIFLIRINTNTNFFKTRNSKLLTFCKKIDNIHYDNYSQNNSIKIKEFFKHLCYPSLELSEDTNTSVFLFHPSFSHVFLFSLNLLAFPQQLLS